MKAIHEIYKVLFPLFYHLFRTAEMTMVSYAIANYAKTCAKNVGGNSGIYIAEKANTTTVAVTTGEVTGITMASGTYFEEVDAEIDTIIRTQTGEGTTNNIKYLHRVEMKFVKPSTALNVLRNALADASPCGILTIITDGNGTSWLTGYNETDGLNRPLRLVEDADTSGATPSDEEGQTVTIALQVESGYLDLPFDATENAAIIAETATYIDFN